MKAPMYWYSVPWFSFVQGLFGEFVQGKRIQSGGINISIAVLFSDNRDLHSRFRLLNGKLHLRHFQENQKALFGYVYMEDEDACKLEDGYFRINGDAPKVIAFNDNIDSAHSRKFLMEGELTLNNIKNDGDVKIVVGNNFHEIVLHESKDVLLEIYASWCPYCQAFEPTYNKLAKHLRGVDSLVISKMDGTTNENPRAKCDGFPTLLFFPAGNKSVDPNSEKPSISSSTQKPKPEPTQKPKPEPTQESSNQDLKDELSGSISFALT
ncbi:hypothetical protein L1887_38334 [Cichorium endivia]|nr:hypothetical protein L1887_38334 [Cichorium endivia]